MVKWAKIPSLSALRAFEAAARNRNFSEAARELNVTPAAIAHHVRSLEADFSASLMVRQGRGVAVTAVGARLADCLSQGFSTIADGIESIYAQSEELPLNVSITPAFAASWLMPRIGDFWAKHPDQSINLNPSVGVVDLRKDNFDLAIRFGAGHWPNVNSELLTDGDFWVVSHPNLLEGRSVDCLPDVADLPWVLESHMWERKDLVESEGINFDQVKLTLLSTNELVMSAVGAGLGISLQPKSLVERQVETGELVRVCKLNQQGIGYYMVTLPYRQPEKLQIFQKWLRSKVAYRPPFKTIG